MADFTDTICALSTPAGRSGLAVVRISGEKSLQIHRKIFKPRGNSREILARKAMVGQIVDSKNKDTIDDAVAVFYQRPKSYTGEDMTEYSVHGSPVLIAELIDCICHQGARLAEPGEFTMRAFINGKMDLAQAEAVSDIIEATTRYQAQVASRQSTGELSRKIEPIKNKIVEIIVQLETAIEFVEEDLTLESQQAIKEKLLETCEELREWIDSYRQGRYLREGFSLAIVGRPNVGKSSLFNALLKQDRSIVMDLPGTTRDMISEYTSIGGIPVRLLDTAGIHDSGEAVQSLGIDRTYGAISDADAILFVLDRSRKLENEDLKIYQGLTSMRCILVLNKKDLESDWTLNDIGDMTGKWPWIEVSAKHDTGIEELRDLIIKKIFGNEGFHPEGVLITNIRHCHCLEGAKHELEMAEKALGEGLSEEFVLIHLHSGLKKIGAITGETTVEDILSDIFSRFCIGK